MERASLASSLSVPTTTRSGFMKSRTADPSLRNSGLFATSNGISRPRAESSPRISALTFRVVPTGTVDLVTTILPSSMHWPTARATSHTVERSADPVASGGVPTVMKTISDPLTAEARSVVKSRRPEAMFDPITSERPGSKKGTCPSFSISTFSASTSTQTTSFPKLARQLPVTRPT